MTAGKLISLSNIVKKYGNRAALDDISLEIHSGITGLLGPNGAGKSTLIKLLLGLVKFNSGTGDVLGHPLGRAGRAIRNLIGYMPEDDCYFPNLSGIEVVQFSACLAGLPPTEALRRAHEILDFCGVKQERYRMIDTYSTGMRQKAKFAAAIVHDPELLILDEPTSGLDPEERESLLNRIQLLSTQANKSVLISTHILPDVQAICDDVLILSGGKVLLHDTLRNLNRTTSPTISFTVHGDQEPIIQELSRRGFRVQFTFDRQVIVEGEDTDLPGEVWNAAEATGTQIRSLLPAKNSLEEIFMATVKEASDART
jgi:ABC-2 type transport system ATP-binding protein